MRIPLSQTLVLKLTITEVPSLTPGGRVEVKPNTRGAAYIVFDTHRDAPVGFGLKVSETKKTYIVQRRVGNKVVKAKVGNVSDYASIEFARNAAREMAHVLIATGQNPNAVAKRRASREITLGQAFDEYRVHLKGRPQAATKNSITALEKAKKQLVSWEHTKIRELGAREIVEQFDDVATTRRTTAEQTFRWASAAVKHVVRLEALDAAAHTREVMLAHNPFDILSIQKKYRTRAQLEKDYIAKRVRNPLSLNDDLPKFLGAVWKRRAENRTACDYLLLLLLWGDRKSEPAGLRWREDLTEAEAATTAWVDIKGGTVFFAEVKSRRDHELPLTKAAKKILQLRRELRETWPEPKKMWVFPARSPFSKSRHYEDASSILGYIRDDAGIEKLGIHDLRRTFGRIAEDLGLSNRIIKRLLGHVDSSNTARYTEQEDHRVLEHLQKIEDAILDKCPNIRSELIAAGKA